MPKGGSVFRRSRHVGRENARASVGGVGTRRARRSALGRSAPCLALSGVVVLGGLAYVGTVGGPAAAARAPKTPRFSGAAPGAVTCSLAGSLQFSGPLSPSGGGTEPSVLHGSLTDCKATDPAVAVSGGKLTGSFASSPLACGGPSATGVGATLSVSWKGSANGSIGGTTYAGGAHFTTTTLDVGGEQLVTNASGDLGLSLPGTGGSLGATGSFGASPPGGGSVALFTPETPAAVQTSCATKRGLTRLALTGTVTVGIAEGCDVLLTAPAGHDCLLPWPNDAFTVPSAATATGRQLAISSSFDPANAKGVHIDPTDENKGDGFSPGSTIMTYVPNLDLVRSGIATSVDIGTSLDPGAPVVIFDTATHSTVPYFAELDANAAGTDEQLLLVHPAVALTEGHRYAVALRHLVDTSGNPIPPLPSTLEALDGTLQPPSRGAHIKSVIQDDLAPVLGGQVPYQAWDFTVASSASIAGPALGMRQLAYQWLQSHAPAGTPAVDASPSFTVTSDTTTNGVRDVKGTFAVPLFLADTTQYSSMYTDADGNPAINGNLTWPANFDCVMAATPVPAGPALPVVYGHGLLGSASEVEGRSFAALIGQDMMGCATNWVGMSSQDTGNLARNIGDMSTFESQVDHMLQGFVNFQFLGRLLNSPDGFATSPAFQDGTGAPLFAVGQTAYLGYSQGGIMGGAVSALSTEWSRVILGVPGMDMGGLLIQRSADFAPYKPFITASYPDPVDQQVGFQLAQLLWDRGESDGYAQHLAADPYPGIPAKQVFILENYGDFSVANVATELLARTIGAQNHQPAFNPSFMGDPPRTGYAVPAQWGLSPLDQTAPAAAGIVLWDFHDTPAPPVDNRPPSVSDNPHQMGRSNPGVVAQIDTFLRSGIIPDECGGAACQAPGPDY